MWRNASSLLLVLLVVLGHFIFIFSFFFIINVIFTIIGTRREWQLPGSVDCSSRTGPGSRPHPELVAVLAWPHRAAGAA
jgi:hypothetical protein